MKLRVLPIVMTGAALLLALKAAGLALTGHYAFEGEKQHIQSTLVAPTYRPTASARMNSPAQPDLDPVITGSVPPKKAAPPEPAPAEPAATEAKAEAPPAAPLSPGEEQKLQNKDPKELSSAEKALLDRLQARRTELDGRAQELDLRENLLRAAEKKIEEEIAELKTAEDRLAAAEAARKAEEDGKLKDLVVMYENMKPKEAAAIFDRLDMRVLVDVATKMNPKKTGDIIAKMEPASAERLTVALARREAKAAPVTTDPQALPKIEGKTAN